MLYCEQEVIYGLSTCNGRNDDDLGSIWKLFLDFEPFSNGMSRILLQHLTDFDSQNTSLGPSTLAELLQPYTISCIS